MNYKLLLQCYRSGQISERQWQEHLKDEGLRQYFNMNINNEVNQEQDNA